MSRVPGSSYATAFRFALMIYFAGPIPEALGALPNLTELSLARNELTGKPVGFGSPRHLNLYIKADWQVGSQDPAGQRPRGTGNRVVLHASNTKCRRVLEPGKLLRVR